MADFDTALRAAVLFVGWPGMVLVSAFVVSNSWRFYVKVQRSPFGRLVVLMVTGWTLTMGVLAIFGTLVLQDDPEGFGAWAAAFLTFWAATMAMIVWIVHRWGSEAVTINLYYTELATMDRIKSQLINTVAHELNTPLTPILLKFSMLRNGTFGPVSTDQEKAIVAIERNLARLQILVEQVVQAMQLQTGQVKVAPAPVRVRDWLAGIVGRFAEQATREGRRIDLDVQDIEAALDPVRLDQAVSTYLSNAMRYSPPGTAVRVSATARDDDLVVEVRDDGAGLTPEQSAVLFEPFRHARDPAQDVQAGAGLSLFLARGVVELHGGRTWGRSDGPGRGSTFGFAVPLKPAPPQPGAGNEARLAPGKPSHGKAA